MNTEDSAITIHSQRIGSTEYTEFLSRTELGLQYPKERFEARIERLLSSASISLTARNLDGKMVGALLGLTDFAYWLFVTDLGVDRAYTHRGIGRRLMRAALKLAGGRDEIAVYLVANEEATGFYEKLGMEKTTDVMKFDRVKWTPFKVGEERK